jgi:hypothetical protein
METIYIEQYVGVGGYLGETIVRHLGGEWIFPTSKDFVDGQKSEKGIADQERKEGSEIIGAIDSEVNIERTTHPIPLANWSRGNCF